VLSPTSTAEEIAQQIEEIEFDELRRVDIEKEKEEKKKWEEE
jgi:hypothetical protein